MIDTIITLILICATVTALYRRPDWVAGILLAALFVATAFGWVMPATRIVGMAAGLDGLVSVAMLFVWTYYHSQRARLVGSVAFFKCCWCLVMASGSSLDWFTFAVVQNSAFIVQVLIAGGWADGLVAFVDRVDPFAVRERSRSVDQLG